METIKNLKPIDYLKCRKGLNKLGISDKEISKALKDEEITVRDLTDEKGFQSEPKYYGAYEVIKENHVYKVEEWKGSFSRKVDVRGILVRIPAQYQGLKHGKIINRILLNRFDWFKKFTEEVTEIVKPLNWSKRIDDLTEDFDNMTVKELKQLKEGKEVKKQKSLWTLYEMNNEDNYEIYLKTEKGSLYVPLKALLKGDWESIKNRLVSYSLSYHDPKNLSGFALNHRGRSKEEYQKDKEKDHAKMIAPIETATADKLKFFLTKKKEADKIEILDYSAGKEDPKSIERISYKGGKFKKVSLEEFYYMDSDTFYLYQRPDRRTGLPILDIRKNSGFQGSALEGFRPAKLKGSALILVEAGEPQE